MKSIFIFLCSIFFPFLVFAQADSLLSKNGHSNHSKKHSDKVDPSPVTKDACCCNALPDGCPTVGSEYGHNISTITVDFRARNNAIPICDFKRGMPVRVRVANYNPYLYKVTVDNKDSTVAPSGDVKLLSWFLDPSNLTAVSAGLSALNIVPPSVSEETNMKYIEKTFWFGVPNQQSKVKIKKALEDKRKKVKEVIENYRRKVPKLQNQITNLNTQIEDSLYEASKALDFLNDLTPGCEKFTALDSNISKLERVFKILREEVAQNRIAIDTTSRNYIIEFLEAEDAASTEPSYKAGDSLIRKFYSEATLLLRKMDSTLSYAELHKITSQLSSLKSLLTCYTSLPIYFTSDIKKFTIALTPWKDSTRLPSYITQFDLPWRKNWIYGASAGLYVSGLHNKGYSNRRNGGADTGRFMLVSDNPGGGLELGINGLAYAAWRIHESFFTGISIGAGMSIESKPKPRAFIGIPFIFGENNRVIVSVGCAAGYVQRLSSSYSTAVSYTGPQSGYMKDYLKANAFLSVHYGFLNK